MEVCTKKEGGIGIPSKLISQMERFFERESVSLILDETEIDKAKRGQSRAFNAQVVRLAMLFLKVSLNRLPTTREISFVAHLDETTIKRITQDPRFQMFVGEVEKKPISKLGWYRTGAKDVGEGIEVPILRQKRWGHPIGRELLKRGKGKPDNVFKLTDPRIVKARNLVQKAVREATQEGVKQRSKNIQTLREIKQLIVKEMQTSAEVAKGTFNMLLHPPSRQPPKAITTRQNHALKRARNLQREIPDQELFKCVESIAAYKWIEIYAHQNVLSIIFEKLKEIAERINEIPNARTTDIGYLESASPHELMDFSKIRDECKIEAIGLVFGEWQRKFGAKNFEEKYKVSTSTSPYQIFQSIGEQIDQVITELGRGGAFKQFLGEENNARNS